MLFFGLNMNWNNNWNCHNRDGPPFAMQGHEQTSPL